jgi:hypothetical protein
MKNQPIEAIAERQEPGHRRGQKLTKTLAVAALSLSAATSGMLILKDRGEGSTRAEALPTALAPNTAQRKADIDELRAINKARVKSYEARQRVEKFLSVVAWNNALPKSIPKPKIPYDIVLWNNLHQCEQAGNWYASGYNSADPGHQLFQGGLGMSTVAWSMAVRDAAQRGVNLPSSALNASIDEQMQGAQVFYEDEGWGWACHVERSG